MHRLCVLFLLLVSLRRPIAAAEEPPLKVLFIGNSYTSVNDLPGLVTALAEGRPGRRIETGQETPGGCTLLKHAQDGKAAAAIRSRKWDVVVLQEQSQLPFMHPTMMREGAKELHSVIREQGATTMLYLTWARQSQPENQAAINRSYFRCAEELRAKVAPVGHRLAGGIESRSQAHALCRRWQPPQPQWLLSRGLHFLCEAVGKESCRFAIEGRARRPRPCRHPTLSGQSSANRRLDSVAKST